MKKIVLAVFLLAVIVAVSYLRSARDQSNRQKLYQEGLDRGSEQANLYQLRADSLSRLMSQRDSAYDDSLSRLAIIHKLETDSLNQAITDRDKEIQQATAKKKASAVKTPPKPRSADSLQTSLKHTQILAYYKRRLAELPKDLSEYERKIALNEVREETSRKFSIDQSELERIRLANNLSE